MSISSYASDSSAASNPHSYDFSLSDKSRQSGMVQPVVNEMFATVHAAGSSLLGLFTSCTTFDSTRTCHVPAHHRQSSTAAAGTSGGGGQCQCTLDGRARVSNRRLYRNRINREETNRRRARSQTSLGRRAEPCPTDGTGLSD
eukprot:scaffold17843_cov131-Isochrysis_galbana.AAC.2